MLKLPEAGADLEATVHAVHGWAMARFVYVPDLERWHQDLAPNGDHWETDAELLADLERAGRVLGDCDAFAKLCWLVLRRLGVPSRLVACQAETGGWHLVCEASGWILDNRMPVATPREDLERLGYRWHSKSDYEPGGQWTTA